MLPGRGALPRNATAQGCSCGNHELARPQGQPVQDNSAPRAFCSQVESLGVTKMRLNKNLERFRVSVKNGNALGSRCWLGCRLSLLWFQDGLDNTARDFTLAHDDGVGPEPFQMFHFGIGVSAGDDLDRRVGSAG